VSRIIEDAFNHGTSCQFLTQNQYGFGYEMKTGIIGALLGSILTILVVLGLGYLPKKRDWSLTERQRSSIRGDITWFARIDGYAELVYRDANLVAALTKPDTVSLFRVGAEVDGNVAGYGLNSEKKLSPDESGFYSWLVTSPTSMSGMSACLFEPGFAIRFERKGRSYYALVCYSCLDMIFYDEQGERVSEWGMTYESAFALLHKFQAAFPDDMDVQKIKF
jgi:hypothetical protein